MLYEFEEALKLITKGLKEHPKVTFFKAIFIFVFAKKNHSYLFWIIVKRIKFAEKKDTTE